MDRLSALDAGFLYLETPDTPMHVGSLTIFASAAATRDKVFERFREHTAARLDLLPSYRRRLEMTPLGLDHPVWVDEDNLDLDYHLHQLTLPRPGTMEQLRALVARLHAIPLDRTRPLWQYHLIEGLEGGGFAVYVKVHHADMDGVAAMATVEVIFDFATDPPPIHVPSNKISSGADRPDFLELLGTANANFLRQWLRFGRSLPKMARAVAKVGQNLPRDVRLLLKYARTTPRTLFNVVISNQRAYGTVSLSLSEAKTVGKARHATINDVVLSLCAGALRRYLSERQALPQAALLAAVPVSLRLPGDSRLNNQTVFTLCRLATDIPDALARLSMTCVASQGAKTLFAEVRDALTTELSLYGAPIVMTGLAQLMAMTRAADVLPVMYNVAISNVPGPRKPIYCNGAPAQHYFPLSIPYHGCALNITVQSYLDNLEFGLTACRATVPDVQVIADYLGEEFEALKRACEAIDRPDAIEIIEIAAPAVSAHTPRVAAKRAATAKPIRRSWRGRATRRAN
jgi:WS/DGAT/MGAT family acyltransferase